MDTVCVEWGGDQDVCDSQSEGSITQTLTPHQQSQHIYGAQTASVTQTCIQAHGVYSSLQYINTEEQGVATLVVQRLVWSDNCLLSAAKSN